MKAPTKSVSDGGIGVFLRVLNEAYKADEAAVITLIENRVPCNATLADHATIQIGMSADGKTEVGLLGIINGICEAMTGKRVAICINDKTGETTGFIEYEPVRGGCQEVVP